MLARSFLSHTDLGIAADERDILIRLLGMMERGEVKSAPEAFGENLADFFGPIGAPTIFNMSSVIRTDLSCGTAACLLGWARFVSDQPELLSTSDSPIHPCEPLFYPHAMAAITCRDAAKGAQALANFLTTGEPRWNEVMAWPS